MVELSKQGSAPDVGHPTRRPFRLWQRGFYDFNIYTEKKLLEKLDYMHNNPVKAGLLLSPDSYEWSTGRPYSLEKVERE